MREAIAMKDRPTMTKRTDTKTAKRGAARGSAEGREFIGALATRIRAALEGRHDVVEKRMFGGLCFMVNGQMCCGLTKTDFMVRVGKDAYADALAEPHARPMDFTGRPLVGMVYVAPEGLRSAAALRKWVLRGVAFVTSNPAPARRPKKKPAAGRAPKRTR